jgi:Uma2 family endonuclease
MSEQATEGARRPVTWAEFVALPEDDLRELIDGELVGVEVPGPLHEAIVADLAYYLGGWVREHGAGRVLGSGYKVRVSETRGVMPAQTAGGEETFQPQGWEGVAIPLAELWGRD